MYFGALANAPKYIHFEQAFDEVSCKMYWLDLGECGRSILIDLSVSNCSYSLAKKDANLRPVAQRTLELFARELVSIYEVKIPAR